MQLTTASVGKAIEITPENWAGRCYEIACRMLDVGVVEGRACYGLYLGDMSQSSLFQGRTFTHHGWIATPDGGLIDPTRWVFENVAPYIFQAPCVPSEYDEGGNMIRLINQRPPPAHNTAGKRVVLPNAQGTDIILSLLGRSAPQAHLCMEEALWLGNLSLHVLKDHAVAVYGILIDLGFQAMIPIDNRKIINLKRL